MQKKKKKKNHQKRTQTLQNNQTQQNPTRLQETRQTLSFFVTESKDLL